MTGAQSISGHSTVGRVETQPPSNPGRSNLSALLVHQLVLRGAATVVITVRTGEPTPDAVTALWKDGHLDRLEVQPLSEPETGALLEAVLGGPVDSASSARMWAVTRGNALYLRHLVVDGELEAGRLHRAGGMWRWSGEPAVSPGLAELVDARMGQLSDAVREVLDVLALSEPLGVPLLGESTHPAAVEQAEASGLVSVQPDGRRLQARLAHPLYGEVRRPRIGQLRTRRLRGRIATALADTGARRVDDTLRHAVLVVNSDLPPDPQLFTVAAQRAILLGDVSLAERLARAAVGAGGGSETRLTLAYALSWLSRGDEAETELAALTELADTDEQRITVAISRAGNLFFSCRRPVEAEEVLHRAEPAFTYTGARCVLTAVQAAFHAYLGRPQQAVDAPTDALAFSALPDAPFVLASYGLVGGLGALGRADEVSAAASLGYEAAARSFDAAIPAFGLCDLHLMVLRLAGYLHAVEDIADSRHRQGSEMPGLLQLLGVALLGYAALYRGRLRTAIRRIREAEAGLGPVKSQGPVYRDLITLTQALAMAGEAAKAREALAELEAERHPTYVLLDPELVLTRAWVAAAEGAVSEAITLAHEAADLAAARGQLAHEVLALHTGVCFGDHTVADRLARLATQVDGPRAPAAAAQAAALAAGDGDALSAASHALEEMGDLLAAADAAAQAATAHTRTGHSGAGHAAAARAQRLAETCEGARTPALAAVTRPLPLTDREREIVTLAARGLSNRQIADRLVVSVRTVEGHLYRAGAKLGTTNRAEFALLIDGN